MRDNYQECQCEVNGCGKNTMVRFPAEAGTSFFTVQLTARPLTNLKPGIHRRLSSSRMQFHGVVLEHRIAGTFITVLCTVFYRGAPLSCHYWEANPKSMPRTNVHTKPLTLLLCWRKFPSKYWVFCVLIADGNCINTQYMHLGSKANQLRV